MEICRIYEVFGQTKMIGVKTSTKKKKNMLCLLDNASNESSHIHGIAITDMCCGPRFDSIETHSCSTFGNLSSCHSEPESPVPCDL